MFPGIDKNAGDYFFLPEKSNKQKSVKFSFIKAGAAV